jgi:hypothetical protein
MRGFAGLAQSDAAILAGECSNLCPSLQQILLQVAESSVKRIDVFTFGLSLTINPFNIREVMRSAHVSSRPCIGNGRSGMGNLAWSDRRAANRARCEHGKCNKTGASRASRGGS